jgi:hypothetical protein
MQVSEVLVSTTGLKETAKKMLPHDSMLRMLILSEPDYLPKGEANIKIGIYARLLYQELKRV